MGEPIWCNVTFKFPATWETGGDDENELSPPWFVSDLQYHLSTGFEYAERYEAGIWHVNGEGNYGLADDNLTAILDWCEAHAVPYEARDEAKYEFEGETRRFNGFEVLGFPSTNNGEVYLDKSTWESIRDGKSDYPDPDAYFAAGYFNVSETDISHLPEHCPEDEDDE